MAQYNFLKKEIYVSIKVIKDRERKRGRERETLTD